MDVASKKRKSSGADENGSFDASAEPPASQLQPSDARRILDPLSKDQLLDILQDAVCRHADILDAVRALADGDVSLRKLFIRGLGWDTTTEGIRSLFSSYGELQEAIVIVDKVSGKSKGYGFVTFRHVDGAFLALKEPSKLIDGRMTVTQLASAGVQSSSAPATTDSSVRKIFVGNVPFDMPAERLLKLFLTYGEVEEGPLGYDKATGKSKGYALFVFKTAEGANAALEEPIKHIDGHQLACKLAIDGKKPKGAGPAAAGPGGSAQGQLQMGGAGGVDGAGAAAGFGAGVRGSVIPGSYGGPGGLSSYGGSGFSSGGVGSGTGGAGTGIQGQVALGHHYSLGSNLPSSLGVGSSAHGGPAASSLGTGALGGGGYGSGYYGGSSQFGGLSASGLGSSGLGASGLASSGYGGLGFGGGHYPLQQGSSGISSGGFPEGGSYGHSASLQAQHQQVSGSSPGSRIPPRGGMYPQGIPPYY